MAAAGSSDPWQVNYPSESGLPGAGSVGASGTEGGVEETTMAVDVNTSSNPIAESGTGNEKGPAVPDDIEGSPLEVGVCGLRNLGNTCYMNAALQSLCAVGHFRTTFLESPLVPSPPLNTKEIPKPWLHEQLAAHLGSIMRKFWSGGYLAVHPKPLRLLLGEIYKPFASSRQQDAQEFLAIVLDSLNEYQLKKNLESLSPQLTEPMDTSEKNETVVTGESENEQSSTDMPSLSNQTPVQDTNVTPVQDTNVTPVQDTEMTSFIADTFQGTLKNEFSHVTVSSLLRPMLQVVCLKCSFSSAKREPFMYLSLPIPHALEEQITVIWITPKHVPQCVLVTVLKHQTFRDVKLALAECMKIESKPNDIVLMESINSRINRKLGDNFEVRSRDRKAELLALLLPNEESPSDEEKAESKLVVEWYTCAVCLDEKEDVELMIHPKCNGMLCKPCLKMALTHSTVCAVCQVPIDESKDIVPMAVEGKERSQAIKLMQVSVLFRREKKSGDSVTMELLGYPMVLNLSTPAPVRDIHQLVEDSIPPFLASLPHTLNLTGFMGRYCSRCEFGSKCTGCAIPPASTEAFSLKPGDFIAVTLEASDDVKEKAMSVHDHSSMADRHDNHVTLEECIEGFSKLELLGNDNPWYCPQCKENRLAQRTLSVQALPNTLIIQLKRFFFQNNFSCKVDGRVEIPLVLEGKVFRDDSTKLHLRSCVCHRGSLSSGHYTAYVCHPNSGQWYYCNDDSVTETEPSSIDPEEVYIMIYEQESVSKCNKMEPLNGMDFAWDNEIGKAIVEWLDPPSSSVVYGPTLPRSSSDTKLSDADKPQGNRKPSFLDDFNLGRDTKDFPTTRSTFGDAPLTRRSLTDITGGVVLRSVKVEGVEIYRSKDL